MTERIFTAVKVDAAALRKKVGMVFQKKRTRFRQVFMIILHMRQKYHGVHGRKKLDEIVETSLRKAALWDEVKRPLKKECFRIIRRTAAKTLYCTCDCTGA